MSMIPHPIQQCSRAVSPRALLPAYDPRARNPPRPRQIAIDLVATYLLAHPDGGRSECEQIARRLEAVAMRDGWDMPAWRDVYTHLQQLARPGGPLLGGDPALGAAFHTCAAHVADPPDLVGKRSAQGGAS